MKKHASYRPWMTTALPHDVLDGEKILLTDKPGPSVATDVVQADINYFVEKVGHVVAYVPTMPAIQVYPFETPYIQLVLADGTDARIMWKQWMDEALIFNGKNTIATTLTPDEFNEMNKILIENTLAIITRVTEKIAVSVNVYKHMNAIFGLKFQQKTVTRTAVVRTHEAVSYEPYQGLDVKTVCMLLELAAFSKADDYIRFIDAFGERKHDFDEKLVNLIYDVLDRDNIHRNPQRANALDLIKRGRTKVLMTAYKSPQFRMNRPIMIAKYVLDYYKRAEIFDFKTKNPLLISTYIKYALSTYDESLFVFDNAKYLDLLYRARVIGPDDNVEIKSTLHETLVANFNEWDLMYAINRIMSYLSHI